MNPQPSSTFERHSRLAALFAEASEAVFMKDLAGRYLYVNRAAARFLCRPPEEILGKTDSDLFPADTAAALREVDRRVLASGETLTLLGAGGQTVKGVFCNIDGEVTGLFGISRDPRIRTELAREVTGLVDEVETPQEAALVLSPLDLNLSAALIARRREVCREVREAS